MHPQKVGRFLSHAYYGLHTMTTKSFKTLFLLPIIATFVAIILTLFLTSDVNSDLFLSKVCGSSDIEVSDFYNRMRSGGSMRKLSNEIAIVNIDSVISRAELASLISSIADASPRIIGVDILFENKKDPYEDEFLSSTLNESQNLVMGQRYDESNSSVCEDFICQECPNIPRGIVNLTSKRRNGIVREYSAFFGNDIIFPSLAASMLKIISPAKYNELPKMQKEEMIRFQPEEYMILEPSEVTDNPECIKDKIVFVGTISEESDLHSTPLSDDYPGVMIHANILSMQLRDDYISPYSKTYTFILGIVPCIIMTLLYVRLSSTQNFTMRTLPIIWIIIILLLGCSLFNNFGIYVDAPRTILIPSLALVVLDTWFASGVLITKIQNRFIKKHLS